MEYFLLLALGFFGGCLVTYLLMRNSIKANRIADSVDLKRTRR